VSVRVVLRARLKVPDTTALSAEDVLRRKMGYGDRLAGLRREDWWLFEVDAPDPTRARERVEDWARRCTSLVNPNKHRASIEPVSEWPPGNEAQGVRILVRDRDDVRAQSILGFLRVSLGASDLVSLQSGTLWTVQSGTSVDKPGQLAREIARTESRRQGLLANPHAQIFEIWE
jgi:hypothetical protein